MPDSVQPRETRSEPGAATLAETPPPQPGAAENDATLIADAVAGDRGAFGRLVIRYQDRLFGSLLRMTGSTEDAQDIAQEAFVQAYLKLDTFAGRSAFYTWLYRIAFNRCMSHGRKRRERTSLDTLTEAGAAEPMDASDAPDAKTQARERSDLLHAAIGRLAEEQRQVIVLREIDGFDYQQIAEVIGTPIGTVRSRLFRARLQLKEMLADPLGESEPAEPT